MGRLQSLVSSGQLGSINKETIDCLSCQIANQSSLSFNKSESVSYAPFDLVHSDVCELPPPPLWDDHVIMLSLWMIILTKLGYICWENTHSVSMRSGRNKCHLKFSMQNGSTSHLSYKQLTQTLD